MGAEETREREGGGGRVRGGWMNFGVSGSRVRRLQGLDCGVRGRSGGEDGTGG